MVTAGEKRRFSPPEEKMEGERYGRKERKGEEGEKEEVKRKEAEKADGKSREEREEV